MYVCMYVCVLDELVGTACCEILKCIRVESRPCIHQLQVSAACMHQSIPFSVSVSVDGTWVYMHARIKIAYNFSY
jgi:hypothetical protein